MYFPKTPPGGRGAATLQVGLMGRGTQENPASTVQRVPEKHGWIS